MDRTAYDEFTHRLTEAVRTDPRMAGLVALGSMAEVTRQPDRWSDHDFWIISAPGRAREIRADRTWIPDHNRLVVWFPDTDQGRTAIYDDGHLIEYAVFETDELRLAKATDFQVLVDDGTLTSRMTEVAAVTRLAAPADDVIAGRMLVQLTVGLNRYGRGEAISAHALVTEFALRSLLTLISRHVLPEHDVPGDELDALRRCDFAHPDLAGRLRRATGRGVLDTATEIIAIADASLVPAIPELAAGLATVAALLEQVRSARPGPTALHHVQLAMPAGEEPAARHFYADILGLAEIEKPPVLAHRGGCWFRTDLVEIHLGVEEPFQPARKVHPGILTGAVDDLAARLEASEYRIEWDPHLPAHRRFYTADVFGNRLEFLQPE